MRRVELMVTCSLGNIKVTIEHVSHRTLSHVILVVNGIEGAHADSTTHHISIIAALDVATADIGIDREGIVEELGSKRDTDSGTLHT